jgi:hypothetical protein
MSRDGRRRSALLPLALLGAALAGGAPRAGAQTLAERVARVGDGSATLRYAVRPGVCGDGGGTIGFGDRRRTIRREWDAGTHGAWTLDDCAPGPARLTLAVERGRVTRLRVAVGDAPAPGPRGATDLGAVSAPAAAAYLLSLAAESEGSAGRQAVFAAALADSAVVWPGLARLARDAGRPRGTRREATFWLAEAAGEAIAPGAERGDAASDAGSDGEADLEVREQAVFALSQRPRDESVPALLRIARTNRDVRIRRKATFWLGQSDDARALDFFEAVLGRR